MGQRSTEEVFLDHLELAQQGDIKADISRNFATDCVLLTSYGTFYGHGGVREAAALLDRQIGPATYEYRTQLWHGNLAFLEWAAQTPKAFVPDGADSYLIRNGSIVVMTIHYSVYPQS